MGLRLGACGLGRSAVIGERGARAEVCCMTPTAARARCSKAVVGREAGRCARVAWAGCARVWLKLLLRFQTSQIHSTKNKRVTRSIPADHQWANRARAASPIFCRRIF